MFIKFEVVSDLQILKVLQADQVHTFSTTNAFCQERDRDAVSLQILKTHHVNECQASVRLIQLEYMLGGFMTQSQIPELEIVSQLSETTKELLIFSESSLNHHRVEPYDTHVEVAQDKMTDQVEICCMRSELIILGKVKLYIQLIVQVAFHIFPKVL